MFKSQIAKHSYHNLLGQAFPLLIGLVVIPKLIQQMGLERFGVLTLVWAVIGYFSFLDFGLSRVMTLKVSAMLGFKSSVEISETFWSILKLILLITSIGAMGLYIFGEWTSAHDFLRSKASESVYREGLLSLKIMALTLPAITLTAGLRGFLEAKEQFPRLSFLQIQMGTFNFLIPFGIAFLSPQLPWIVFGLALLRYLYMGLHLRLCFSVEPALKNYRSLPLSQSTHLMREGGWVSISNVIGPVMVYFDRFFVAAMIPTAQIPYYTTPAEIVSRLLILPSALSRTLFPAFAKQADVAHRIHLYRRGSLVLAVIMFGIVLFGIAVGRFALKQWLGEEFAENSYPALAILLVGIGFNSVAWIPFALIQGLGRSDLTAKVHLVELPLYITSLWFLISNWGLRGAALAWTLRCFFDYVILSIIAGRIIQGSGDQLHPKS